MNVMISRAGKAFAKQKPLTKNEKKAKKPKPWDDTIHDLSIHKMSTDALARRRAIRQQNRAIESRSTITAPSTSKEISWTKTLNYEEQQEQMLREMFANKGRLWSVLKNEDRASSVTPLSRRESRRPVSSLFSAKARIITSRSLPPDMRHRSPPHKTFPRFRGLPNITSAPCSAGPPQSRRLLSTADAGTACPASGDVEATGNQTPPSSDRSERRQALSDQEFSNDEADDDYVNEGAENEDGLDSANEASKKEPKPEPKVEPKPEPKPAQSRTEDLSFFCLSEDQSWPPNPASTRRPMEFVRSEIHRALAEGKEAAGEKTSRTGPKFTGIGASFGTDEVENENNDNHNSNHMNDKQNRLLRRINIQPVNDETAPEESESDVVKSNVVESSKKNELEEAKRLVDALTLEVMTTNRRHDALLEEFEAFKEKTRKEVGALQEAVTLLATHLRLKPVIRQTESLSNEMSLEVQGHTCADRASTATDDTDASDNFYGHYDSGDDMRGVFVDRNSLLDKLQAIQRLEQEQAAYNTRNDQ